MSITAVIEKGIIKLPKDVPWASGTVVRIEPVDEVSPDYALQEYGLTPKEMAAAARGIKSSIASERRNGTLKTFTGKVSDLRD